MLVSVSTFAIYVYEKIKSSGEVLRSANIETPTMFKEYSTQDMVGIASNEIAKNISGNFWMWFLGGAVLTLIIFSILNWRKL